MTKAIFPPTPTGWAPIVDSSGGRIFTQLEREVRDLGFHSEDVLGQTYTTERLSFAWRA